MSINFNNLSNDLKAEIFKYALMRDVPPVTLASVCKVWNKVLQEKIIDVCIRKADPEFIFALKNVSSKEKGVSLRHIQKLNQNIKAFGFFLPITLKEICHAEELKKFQNALKNMALLDLWFTLHFQLSAHSVISLLIAYSSNDLFPKNADDFLETNFIDIDNNIGNLDKKNLTNILDLFVKALQIFKPSTIVQEDGTIIINTIGYEVYANENGVFLEKKKSIVEQKEIFYKFYNEISNINEEIKLWLKNPENTGKFKNLNFSHLLFPKELWELKQLETLELNKVCLSTLPEQIENLQNLKKLNLLLNKFKKLPSSLEKLPLLTSLNITKNRFKIFPEETLKLKNLKELYFSENLFTVIPEQIKEKFPNEVNAYIKSDQFLFLNYSPQSTLGKVSQEIFKTGSKRKFTSLLNQLKKSEKEDVLKQLSENYFFSAIDHMIRNKLYYLTHNSHLYSEVINKIYCEVYRLSGSPATDDDMWGQRHVFDNILILADAISLYEIQYTSPLAKLWKAIENNNDLEEIKNAFNSLNSSEKNAIYGMFWKIFGSPLENDPQWGEHHLFDNFDNFHDALHSYTLYEKFYLYNKSDKFIEKMEILLGKPFDIFQLEEICHSGRGFPEKAIASEAIFLVEQEQSETK